MGYLMGVCPQCNNVMSMPDDAEKVRCPTCQAEVLVAEAAALAGNTPAPAPAAAPQPEVQQSPYFQQPQQGAQPNPIAYQQMPGDPYTQVPGYTSGAPALDKWTTSPLLTVAGILAALIVNAFVSNQITAEAGGTFGGALGILALAYLVFSIVYAAKIYPSYFTDKPMIDSPEAISFLNAFAGGALSGLGAIIFGLLWNHNLTLRNKGVSNIVFIVLIAASFVLAIVAGFAIVSYMASNGGLPTV